MCIVVTSIIFYREGEKMQKHFEYTSFALMVLLAASSCCAMDGESSGEGKGKIKRRNSSTEIAGRVEGTAGGSHSAPAKVAKGLGEEAEGDGASAIASEEGVAGDAAGLVGEGVTRRGDADVDPVDALARGRARCCGLLRFLGY